MAIRRVPHYHQLRVHVGSISKGEKEKVRHIHIDSIGLGVIESLKELPHLILVTHEPGLPQDKKTIEEIRARGISVAPLATPKKKKESKSALPEWYSGLIE